MFTVSASLLMKHLATLKANSTRRRGKLLGVPELQPPKASSPAGQLSCSSPGSSWCDASDLLAQTRTPSVVTRQPQANPGRGALGKRQAVAFRTPRPEGPRGAALRCTEAGGGLPGGGLAHLSSHKGLREDAGNACAETVGEGCRRILRTLLAILR